jgi:SAM-dependent methyltransferase
MPNDVKPTQVFIVSPVDFDRQTVGLARAFYLEYEFTSDHPADGFAAWSRSVTDKTESVDVAASCKFFTGGFRQQALNRIFARNLLKVRPNLVVVAGLTGCTVDLPRLSNLMGVPTVLLLDEPVEEIESLDEGSHRWLEDAVNCSSIVVALSEEEHGWPEDWIDEVAGNPDDINALLQEALRDVPEPTYRFDYAAYEFCQRDHPLLVNMQKADVAHFAGCDQVLDVGCGAGIFLDCLRQEGIRGVGVERDHRIAAYGRGMGLDIVTEDALTFLERLECPFDGIYCSHFVEHLPYESVQRLLELLTSRTSEGGIVVLVFPDPESIRSQLLGFWRDPEHVRFYHPDLITALANSVGLELEWSSHQAQPHKVVSFPWEAPAVGPVETPPYPVVHRARPAGFMEKLLYRMGLVPRRHLERIEEALQASVKALHQVCKDQGRALAELEKRTDALWDVNLTWAWNDNATMRFRKRVT